jgi:hypothetical protein
LVDTKEWDNYVINSNLDCGHKTSANFAQLAAKTLQSIRPADHLQGVTLTDSRNATEQALLDAFS